MLRNNVKGLCQFTYYLRNSMFVVLEEIRHACIKLSIFPKTYYQRLKLDIFFSLDATYRPPGLSM